MVKGLDLFKAYFSAFPNNYLIFGGTARDIIMEDAGFVNGEETIENSIAFIPYGPPLWLPNILHI